MAFPTRISLSGSCAHVQFLLWRDRLVPVVNVWYTTVYIYFDHTVFNSTMSCTPSINIDIHITWSKKSTKSKTMRFNYIFNFNSKLQNPNIHVISEYQKKKKIQEYSTINRCSDFALSLFNRVFTFIVTREINLMGFTYYTIANW